MTTGLRVFDATIQEANPWLKEVEANLGDCERLSVPLAVSSARKS